jgi:hypothetical protein
MPALALPWITSLIDDIGVTAVYRSVVKSFVNGGLALAALRAKRATPSLVRPPLQLGAAIDRFVHACPHTVASLCIARDAPARIYRQQQQHQQQQAKAYPVDEYCQRTTATAQPSEATTSVTALARISISSDTSTRTFCIRTQLAYSTFGGIAGVGYSNAARCAHF